MNEISKLIEAYNRFWKNLEIMRQDIVSILETDFGMENFEAGDFAENVPYNTYFKEKMVLYIILDVSVEIPFLQIFKLDILNSKKSITSDFLKKNEYKKYNPNDDFVDKKNEELNGFSSFRHAKYVGTVSPKIDILSIDSTDTVNTEVKKIISCMIDKNYKSFTAKKLKYIE
jgi:hypothetical protein